MENRNTREFRKTRTLKFWGVKNLEQVRYLGCCECVRGARLGVPVDSTFSAVGNPL